MWKEAKAPDGRTYYYHTETKETRWVKPTEPELASAPRHDQTAIDASWRETTAADGRKYYYNTLTRETKWEPPPAFLRQQEQAFTQHTQGNAPEFVAGSGIGRSVSNGYGPTERRMDRRDASLPQKPAFDGGRGGGAAWEPRGEMGGFRGPMPPKTDEPEYATFEQAEEAFFKVLRKHDISPDISWEDALRIVIREKDYRALKDPRERRQAFEKYCIETRAEAKVKEQERREKLREDFRKMLATHDNIKHYTRWKTARPSIEREAVFKQASSDEERKLMFAEYVAELKVEHAKATANEMKSARQELDSWLWSNFSDADELFDYTIERITKKKRLVSEPGYDKLPNKDALERFTKYLGDLDRRANEARKKELLLKARRDRKARDAFKQMLANLVAERKINAYTKWQEVFSLIKDDQRLLDVLDTKGSTPIDMFWDTVVEQENILRSKSNDALDVLEDKRYEMDVDTKFDDFANVMRSDGRTAKLDDEDLRLIYKRMMDKIFRRKEEAKVVEQRQERKAVEALKITIKRLDPPVRSTDTYEDVASRLADHPDFIAVSEEGRKHAFEKYIRRLQEREEDNERERARRERDRERDQDRERERERDRDHRNGARRDRRHRTRSPEVDAYEADRRRAQADRERQYRKASFGLTPPRERRDEREDRARRPHDSHYDRERRERELERERNYISRADPRDRSRVLDYGDEDGASSRPSSIRKRQDSEGSIGSRRDMKRLRRGRTPDAKAPEEEAPQLQSGSEEGEIEEV